MTGSAQVAFTPLQIGPLRLRNRFIKAASNEGMAPAGVPSKLLVEHHRAIAAGGVGLSTLAYCAVEPDGRTFTDQIELNAATLPHLRVLTDAVHREGAAACAQITHGGAFNFLPKLSTRYPGSASSGFNPPGLLVGRWFKRAMGKDELNHIAERFVHAARQAREAGFDAVEIHMGHGYLLSQFISPLYNRRKDAYGGSAAARTRFPAEVLSRVLDAVGNDLAVTCKISVTEGCRRGGTTDDALAVARVLEQAGAHLLVLSAGMNVESPWAIFGSRLPAQAGGPVDTAFARLAGRLMLLTAPKMEFHENYLREHSLKLRAALQLPLAYLGGATSMQGIDQVLTDGFDAVAMARALIHDAEFVNKLQSGAVTQSGCTACNACIPKMYQPTGIYCVLGQANDPRLRLQAAAGRE